MSTTTLSSNGQLTIPNHLREALHLRPGDKVTLTLKVKNLWFSAMKRAVQHWLKRTDAKFSWLRPALLR